MRNQRRGFSLVELAAACGLLLVVASSSVELIALVAQARRTTDQQLAAAGEAANAMERLMAVPWDELTPQRAAEERLSAAAASSLHGGHLSVTLEKVAAGPAVNNLSAGPTALRIRVEVLGGDGAGQPIAPVRLTAWKFRPSTRK